jgi:hypothetical protein
LQEKEVCPFTKSFGSSSSSSSSRSAAENTMQEYFACSQNRFLRMKKEKING